MSLDFTLRSLVPSTLSLCASALLAGSLAFGCGTVDPADNQPGAGGDGSSAGDGTGDTGTGGAGDAGAANGGSAGDAPVLEPLLPFAIGNSWTYKVTKDGEITIKTTTIGELEAIGGEGPYAEAMAYHVTTAKGADEKDHTESWQAPDAETPLRVLRYREQSFGATTGKLQLTEEWDPPKIHVDGTAEHTVAGANWLEIYSETKLEVGLSPTTHDVHDRWIVKSDDETLEVPAGTFDHVIHFQKVGGSSTKDYWYLRGVGKLKETGSQTEELTEFSLAEAP